MARIILIISIAAVSVAAIYLIGALMSMGSSTDEEDHLNKMLEGMNSSGEDKDKDKDKDKAKDND